MFYLNFFYFSIPCTWTDGHSFCPSGHWCDSGGALHVHDFSMTDVEWLVKNVTYWPHCYICFTDNQSVRFLFSSQFPKTVSLCSPWVLLEDLRARLINVTDLDNRWLTCSGCAYCLIEACVCFNVFMSSHTASKATWPSSPIRIQIWFTQTRMWYGTGLNRPSLHYWVWSHMLLCSENTTTGV